MLVVDGTFEEQIEELAQYLDTLSGDDSTKILNQVNSAIEEEDKEAAIRHIIDSCTLLQSASEKEYESSHNLFLHILTSSSNLSQYIPTVLQSLEKPPVFTNGPTTICNLLGTLTSIVEASQKANILLHLLQFCQTHELYDQVALKIKLVPSLLKEWQSNFKDARAVYVKLADLTQHLENERETEYLIRAVKTFTADDDSTALTSRMVDAVIIESNRFTYNDLLVLPAVQSLQNGSPAHHEILSILATGNHADYLEFSEEYPVFFQKEGIDAALIEKKCKLLTLVNLAAKQDSRKLRYQSIAVTLDVPESDVEMWVIDAIKTGLVEGRLSQTSQTFLIHRATFRSFDPDQWEEVSAKLASWKESLQGILEVVDNVRNDLAGGPQQLTNGYDGSIDGDADDEGGHGVNGYHSTRTGGGGGSGGRGRGGSGGAGGDEFGRRFSDSHDN